MNRFFLALVLAATSPFAISNTAIAASTPSKAVAVTASSAPLPNAAVDDLDQTENGWNLDQESHRKLTELAQYWVPASYCQTFAGLTCPMLVAVPIGAPCTCSGNGVFLPGVAH
jgi:hypothetical protein